MHSPGAVPSLLGVLGLPDGVTACLFDLDGVLTTTERVHAAAWKEAFDAVLAAHDGEPGVDATPFDKASDYHRFVDGKPRYDGVRSFLTARGITLPEGTGAPGEGETIRAVGDAKNARVQELIQSEGVDPFPGSVSYLQAASDAGLRIAVVSSSANAEAILEAGGLANFIELRVDGKTAAEEGIPGKPAPDMFLTAAERLGASVEQAVVFEDAISGVQAGAAGGFFVVGVDRGGQPDALRAAGASVVVDDLADLLSDSAPTPTP